MTTPGSGEGPDTVGPLTASGDDPTVTLTRWRGPWPDGDPDANFKIDVAAYADADPLATLTALSRNVEVPVGALVRYVLARWASGGAEALLELGPSTVERMTAVIRDAEADGGEEARLAAYDTLRQMIEWVRVPLDDPAATPGGGAQP